MWWQLLTDIHGQKVWRSAKQTTLWTKLRWAQQGCVVWQGWRCLAVKMASCDTSCVKLTTGWRGWAFDPLVCPWCWIELYSGWRMWGGLEIDWGARCWSELYYHSWKLHLPKYQVCASKTIWGFINILRKSKTTILELEVAKCLPYTNWRYYNCNWDIIIIKLGLDVWLYSKFCTSISAMKKGRLQFYNIALTITFCFALLIQIIVDLQ